MIDPKRPDWRAKLVLATATGLFCLGFLEVALRIVAPPKLWQAGTAATPKARLYGWANPPNEAMQFIDPDTGKVSHFRTNSQGWKDVERSFSKTAGVVRILFLGDSNTWGAVPLESLYTRHVESLLRGRGFENVEVVSMGVGGWGTDQILEALTLEGIRYAPDVVVYQFCGNDITDNIGPKPGSDPNGVHWAKTFRYELRDGELVRIKLNPPAPRRPQGTARLKQVLLRSALVYNLNVLVNRVLDGGAAAPAEGGSDAPVAEHEHAEHWWQKHGHKPTRPLFAYRPGDPTPAMAEAWRLFEAIVLRMREVAEATGAAYAIFSEAGDAGKRDWELRWKRIATDAEGDYVTWQGQRYPIDLRRPHTMLEEVCRRNDIALITPVRSYARHEYDPHANADGNLSMAQDIADFLAARPPLAPREE